MSENPFSRLPVEILREILSRVPGRIDLHLNHHFYAGSGSHSPWDLALVCRDWRDAVFSTPSIWSDISIEVIRGKKVNHKCNALLSTSKLCLDRSCNHPLTIEFATSHEGPSDQDLFMELLMEHAHQLETFTINASLDILLPYLSDSPVQYTRLRCLRIVNDRQQPTEDWVGLFQDAPLLSSVSLYHLPHYTQRLGGVGIPWSQITDLKLYADVATLDELIDILQHTSNLVTFHYCLSLDYFGQGDLPMLELPHLEELVWESYDNHGGDAGRLATSHFFEVLKTPQLSALLVGGVCRDRVMEAIRGCIQRSRCSITSLYLTTPHLSSLLRLTPDIKTLMFTNLANLDDDVDGDGSLHLVHLEKIMITEKLVYGDAFDISPLFEVLKAPKLSELVVDCKCSDREVESVCGCLQRSGCSIRSLKLPTHRLPSQLRNLTLDVETLVLPSFAEEPLISLLKQLTFDHSANSWFFPKLTKFALDFDIADGPPFDGFIGMLKSRLWVPPDSSVIPQCRELKELELRNRVSRDMRHKIQERLTSQEHLVIRFTGPPY